MEYMMKMITLLFMLGFLSANSNRDITDGCDLPDSETTGYLYLTSDWAVLYKSPEDIAGFQFDVDDATVNGASGGATDDAGFMISSTTTTVLAFSLIGNTIPAGCGTLVNLDINGEATGLSGIVISDAIGVEIDFEYYEDEDNYPYEFQYNQSTMQAFYFINSVSINEELIDDSYF